LCHGVEGPWISFSCVAGAKWETRGVGRPLAHVTHGGNAENGETGPRRKYLLHGRSPVIVFTNSGAVGLYTA